MYFDIFETFFIKKTTKNGSKSQKLQESVRVSTAAILENQWSVRW